MVRTTQGLSADGAFFLTEVDVYFKQIIPVQAQYSMTALQNAANPSAQPVANTGAVLPQTPAPSLISELGNASLTGASGGF